MDPLFTYQSIISWKDMVENFHHKVHPTLLSPTNLEWSSNTLAKGSRELSRAWAKFNDLFRKCPNLVIPKQTQVYIFYYDLLLNYWNMTNASANELVIKMGIDEVHALYERMAKIDLCSRPTRIVKEISIYAQYWCNDCISSTDRSDYKEIR